MKRISVELKIIILLIFATVAVLAAGYLAYNSINFILSTIKKEAQPNLSLVVLKEINVSLEIGESNVEYYNLTGNDKYLKPYYEVISTVDEKIDLLNKFNKGNKKRRNQIDTISYLLEQKFLVWERILAHRSDNRVYNALNELSEALTSTTDTVTIKVPKSVKIEFYDTNNVKPNDNNKSTKSNIFARLFKKKPEKPINDTSFSPDTIIVEEKLEAIDTAIAVGIDKTKLEDEITRIKEQEDKDSRRHTAYEVSLNRKNLEVSLKLEQLISKMENEELELLKKKTIEADNLVKITNKWSIIFLITFLILLLSVVYIIQRYIRKSLVTQNALIETKNAALKLSRTREQFLANMSHEIRTPMNSIIGFTDQVLQMPLEKKPREQLKIVKDSAEHLLLIINDILDISKLDANKLILESNPFLINDLLKQTYNLFKPSAESKKIKLVFHYPKDKFQVLIGDSLRLKQIIFNLLSNAIKFTPKGEIVVVAEMKELTNNKVKLTIKVKDSGIGIPTEKIDSIFEEFTQAESSTSRKHGGTGLGLAIVHRLVSLQKGKISVKNNPNKGACFIISINYDIGKQEDLSPKKVKLKRSSAVLSGLNFLVADDDNYNRKLIQHILEKWGVAYKVVSNGETVIKELRERKFDLILLDIHMPKMNGYEVASAIRNKSSDSNAKTPIIALTANTGKENQKKCINAGINTVMAKPYTENELLDTIYSILEIPDSEIQSIPEDKKTLINSELTNSATNEFQELYKLANNDKQFVIEMLEMFISSTEKSLVEMQKYLSAKNWKELAELAHKIKSPCRHLDAQELSIKLKELELIARKEENEKEITELYISTKKEITALIEKVKLHLAKNFLLKK